MIEFKADTKLRKAVGSILKTCQVNTRKKKTLNKTVNAFFFFFLTAGAKSNQNLLHSGSPIRVVGAEIAGVSEKTQNKNKPTTSTHAASEQSKQHAANQQEIVIFQSNIGPLLDCSSNQWKCFSPVNHF